jgi:hypothetical protein
MDDYYDFDPQHNIDYGKTSRGNEVLIINSRELFLLKNNGKRIINKILLVVMLLYHLPEMMLL